MRVPVSWLREFVDVAEGATADEILESLVSVGFEEEAVHRIDLSGPVVVGQVLSFVDEPQTNGKTIRWCQVDVGEPEPRGIVCGAHNFDEADKVVVSLPGAILPGPFPISARKTYGHVSDGMIASARELGLGDEHEGILRLATLGLDPAPGTDAIALLGLDDFAVEINVTPDRGYAFSMRGVAREYSHATGAAFRDPAVGRVIVAGSGFRVSIDDQAPVRGRVGASVFVTRAVRNVDAARPTPAWMVTRLKLAGIRSISVVVDITNYVMLELGQPIHGYDLDKLTGGITVRRAHAGEPLLTLDGQTRLLHQEDLLITDDSGPVGLAGVMGGASTEIGPGTTAVLVEAANFDPTSIARTARRHKLPSEASKRFERGVDPRVAAPAADRVVQLLVELAGGSADPLASSFDEAPEPGPIQLPEGFISGLVGVDYSPAEILASLGEIGAAIEAVPTGLVVTPPSWRPDLSDAASLAEEVARLLGYERIPSVLPVAPPGRGLTRTQLLRRSVAAALAAAGGTEVLGYPFVSEAAQRLVAPDAPSVKLANPLDAGAALLRRSLLPGLLEIARRNLSRGLVDLGLFEIGTVFLPETDLEYGSGQLPIGNERPDDAALAALNESIPPQPWKVGALFTGDAVPKQPDIPVVPAGLADALAAVHQVGAALGLVLRVATGTHPALHPGRTACVYAGDVMVGIAGELLPSLARELDLPRAVALMELDLDSLIDAAPTEVVPTPISGYPAATQDLSLVVSLEVPAGGVLDAIQEGAGDLLEYARLVDDYRGSALTEGSKSLTFALRFRAPDRTLTAEEATAAKFAGLELAASRFGARLRE